MEGTAVGVIKGDTRSLDNGSYTNIFERALGANPASYPSLCSHGLR